MLEKVVSKKPLAWKGTEKEEFSAVVKFPETFDEAKEMGYPEDLVMAGFISHQTIRAQAVINSGVGKPEDWEDEHIPTDEEVQNLIDDYDFTSVKSNRLTVEQKAERLGEDADVDDIDKMLAALQAQKEAKLAQTNG